MTIYSMYYSNQTGIFQDNFAKEILETKHPQPPTVVCFYSPRSSPTLNYLSGFHRAYDTFSKMSLSVRFGILNIAEYPQGNMQSCNPQQDEIVEKIVQNTQHHFKLYWPKLQIFFPSHPKVLGWIVIIWTFLYGGHQHCLGWGGSTQ